MTTTRKSVSLNVNQMRALRKAIVAVDGYNHSKQNNEIVYVLFTLGATRLDLAKLSGAITPHLDEFEKARVKLVNECKEIKDVELRTTWEKADILPGHPNWERFQKAYDEMSEKTVSIKYNVIPKEALRLDINEIPISALEALSPFIED